MMKMKMQLPHLMLLLITQSFILLRPVLSFTFHPNKIQSLHNNIYKNTIMKSSNSQTQTHNFSSTTKSMEKKDPFMPSMIVFDLDDCLWSPEMYTLHAKPSIPIEGDLNPDFKVNGDEREIGVTGIQVPRGPTVSLFPGARKALREIALDPKYQGVIIAAASSSEEPTYSHACLNNIEIVPGLTMRDMFTYDEIGRTGHLTSRKTTHFKALHEDSGIPYKEMLFFDDCNWGDHCADITSNFGVVSQRTPRGMQLSEFHQGLEKYRKEVMSRSNE